MTVTVREARQDDRETVVAFTQALNLHEHRLRPDRDTTLEGAEAHLASLEDEIQAADGFVLVAELDGVIVGFLIGISEVEQGHFVVPEERPYGHITDIYVAEDARGNGVSRAMMDAALERFRRMGLKRALVTGLADNPSAGATYPALGFDLLYNTYEKRLAD